MEYSDYIEYSEELRYENNEIDTICCAHGTGYADAMNDLPTAVIAEFQRLLHEEFGDTVTLVHGSDAEISADLNWRENSSFTDEFDLEFSGEDGWIAEAVVPVERIKFYMREENEFILSAGVIEDCTVYTVRDYFGL